MAGAPKRGFPFRRRSAALARAHARLEARTLTIHRPGRGTLVSSAARLDVADRQEAKVQRMLRQGWQSDAWNYRDQIGELRYAVNFLANCTARMRLFPACYALGGESDDPVALDQVPGIPDLAIAACQDAMRDLGNGRTAISGMLHSLSTNKSVAGESYLLGRTDEQTGVQRWSLRSVDELVVYSDRWHLREIPDDRNNSVIPWIELDPELTVISRIWTPHPRFALLADAPLRAMLDDCETLGILRRLMRAEGRSRLATRGLLLMPEEMSIKTPDDQDDDPEADPFLGPLTQAMMAPMVSEGTADGVVPIIVRGPAAMLKEIRLLDMGASFDAEARANREELIGIIATTFDLPKEVINGLVDLNHWSAWQVDDNTFRHHVEPHVIGCCDDLSSAYLRPYLAARGVEDFWVQRLALWYDPTELVTHPDQTKDALDLHDRLVISNEALLRVAGFEETDAPSTVEFQIRLLHNMRQWPPNVVAEFLHQLDPTMTIPPITVAGTVPGIKPTGVDTGNPASPAIPAAPAIAPATGGPPSDARPTPGPPPAQRPTPGPPPITAAANRQSSARLSRRLSAIDSELRARLQTAANAALLRALERAGSRLRSKVARDETLRTRIAHRPNERVPAILGPDAVSAAGVRSDELISGDWAGLRSQFLTWTEAAQSQAIATALRIGRLDADSDAAQRAQEAMAAGRDAGWTLLSEAMSALGRHLLYSPDPNLGPGEWAELHPDTLVPVGTIRAALGVAGGAPSASALIDAPTGAVTLDAPVGQIGTGATIEDLISAGGGQREGYQWIHGPALKPFPPHEALDGVEFEKFDDEVLANTDHEFDNAFYMPGDHQGCLCDFQPIYLSPDAGQ